MTQAEKIVEAVARAICCAAKCKSPESCCWERFRRDAELASTATLKAIEEPHEGQLAAAARYCNKHANKQTVGQAVTQSYKLMVAHLLKELGDG